MKVAIIGSRTFNNYDTLVWVVKDIDITLMVSGGAKGADTLGERYADEEGIEKLIFKPQWGIHGRAAGMIRYKR